MLNRWLKSEEKATRPYRLKIVIQRKSLINEYGETNYTKIELRNKIGNRAAQRMINQNTRDSESELNDEITDGIKHEYGSGQKLQTTIQEHVGVALGQDFSKVQIHLSAEADELSRKLGARAFTTGQDIFFRYGEYQPDTTAGQELIAHELTHVVQQSAGRVPTSGSGKMTVRPAGDEFEREADAVAKAVTSPTAEAQVQRQIDDEEEEIQTSPLQRQALDEEENIQTQAVEEEEELPE
jgi:hypothetical protein